MHLRSAALLALALTAGACKPPPTIKVPAAASLGSLDELPEPANALIFGLVHDRAAAIRTSMTPGLRAQVSARDLLEAGARIRKTHGVPQAIVESKIHKEDELTWYSELVLHKRSVEVSGKGPLRLMLYQFALDDQKRVARLLVREHVRVSDVRAPAERYLAITRFHFPSVGEWTVIHGGRRASTNYHHGSRGQRYAYDIVVREAGRARKGKGKGNATALCYGKPITAPAPGVVVVARDGVPENRPGEKGKGGGNGVVIDHGFGEYTSLWHMIPGTVQVKVGDQVELGQHLGDVGNSGHSSGPHIHFHASTDPRSKNTEMGIPAPFVDVYIDGVWMERGLPVRDQRVRRPPLLYDRRLAASPTVYLAF
ncbi:MAG: M23 family metallopeptidase [Myxococcales bacterium]|nr:M23 family metallopeptidase [Myxococcales bacterium]MCB9567667.1 M23 family metallopeptidase [Myxococcales bacterium]MCB9702517.1 M23 family metallopeptidase [Myxococcales bacterium]